jgi:hypothetical protein
MLKVVGRLPLNFSFKETALPNITEFCKQKGIKIPDLL